MIRTRDLLVFVVTGSFLLVAITVTAMSGGGSVAATGQTANLGAAAEAADMSAAVTEADDSADPASAREAMRERIAAYRAAGGTDSEQFVLADRVAEEAELAAEDERDEVADEGVQRCSTFTTYTDDWPSNVQLDEREGARIVSVPASDTTGTSSAPAQLDNVLLQLPVPMQPRAGSHCVASDVIGVAKEGALIRNDEVGLYSIFDSSTVVGYALDGFPIYGTDNSVSTDQCGGATVAGQYGYVLQEDRATVVECFRGLPATL